MAILEDVNRPIEGIRHEQPNTSLFLKSQPVGAGTLYITESLVTWLTDDGKGFVLPYLNISLHAICRDTNVFPHDCLYVHTDAELGWLPRKEEGDEEDDDSDCPPITELFFVPEDKESLNAMYQTMSICQTLHPDPADDFSPDDDEFFDDENEEHIVEADSQMADLRITTNGSSHADDIYMDPECFEDAEDDGS